MVEHQILGVLEIEMQGAFRTSEQRLLVADCSNALSFNQST